MDDVNVLPTAYTEESYLFFVDSGQRNKLLYPTSNNYSITISPPFTNVTGLDLITATIPRTEYLLDHNANNFVYRIQGGGWKTLVISPGDFNIQQLQAGLTQAIGLTDGGAGVSVTGVTDNLDVSSRLKFVCSEPFEIDMTGTTMRSVLGFNDPISPGLAAGNYAIPAEYAPGAPEYFASIRDSGNAVASTVYQGPNAVLDAAGLSSPAMQTFTALGSGEVTGMSVSCFSVGSPAPAVLSPVVTNMQSNAVVATLTVPLAQGAVFPAVSNACVAVAPLQAGAQYSISLPAIGADSGNTFAVAYTSPAGGQSSNSFTSGSTVYATGMMCCSVTAGSAPNVILAPGVYNLTGQRYITLKCPQIESHLYRGRPYDPFSYGLARIPLTGFGIGSASFDFASVPRRRFSPLARLSELSFQFVRADGSDYDFKGVDHTLTFVCRYYVPPVAPVPASLLRNYEPDPRKFAIQRLQQREDEEWERQRRQYLRGAEATPHATWRA